MAYINAINTGVGPAPNMYRYSSNSRTPVRFKNVGETKVYIGSVLETSENVVDYQAGYPLSPGESVELPGLLSSDDYVYAYNTATGIASRTMRIVSLIED